MIWEVISRTQCCSVACVITEESNKYVISCSDKVPKWDITSSIAGIEDEGLVTHRSISSAYKEILLKVLFKPHTCMRASDLIICANGSIARAKLKVIEHTLSNASV